MSLRVGQPVPDHSVQAYVRGERAPAEFALSSHRGRWVVLFFYPRDFTFICPTELAAFADLHDDFVGERAVVLGASTDSYFSHKAWFESDPRLANINQTSRWPSSKSCWKIICTPSVRCWSVRIRAIICRT